MEKRTNKYKKGSLIVDEFFKFVGNKFKTKIVPKSIVPTKK